MPLELGSRMRFLQQSEIRNMTLECTRVGGIAEQLDHDRHGTTVAPGRPDLLGDALLRLMTDRAALTDARSRAQQGLAYYQVGRMADEYRMVYEAAIRARNPVTQAGSLHLGTSSGPGK